MDGTLLVRIREALSGGVCRARLAMMHFLDARSTELRRETGGM